MIKLEKEKYWVLDIETMGLNPWYGRRITAIGIKSSIDNKDLILTDGSEESLLIAFWTWFEEEGTENFEFLVTKNGKMFDVPFILARSHLLCFETLDRKPPIELNIAHNKLANKLLDFPHKDLHEITDKWVSLNDMAKILGCEEKIGTGKNAIKLWKEGKIELLKTYLRQDLRVTMQVYERIKLLKNIGYITGEIDTQIKLHKEQEIFPAVRSMEYIKGLIKRW